MRLNPPRKLTARPVELVRRAPLPRHRLFPMLAVEQSDAGHAHRSVVEAAHIDAKAVWLGARHVEALDTAHRTEMMLRRASVEGVGGEHAGALDEAEAFCLHDEMQIAGHAAQRA